MIKLLLVLNFLLLGCSSIKENVKGYKEHSSHFNVLWNKSLDPKYQSGNLPISLAAPFVKEGLVYLGTMNNEFKAYDLQTGREIWSVKENSTYNSGASVDGEMVYYGNSAGRFFSRDRFTGKLNYSVDLGAAVESRPSFFNGRVVVHLRNHKIVVLDQKVGKILWTYQRSVAFKTTLQRASRPVIWNNKIYVGFADGQAVCFRLEDGQILWEQKLSTASKFIDVDLTAKFHNGEIFIGSLAGELSVLDKDTGNLKRRFEFSASRAPYFYERGSLVGTVNGQIIDLDIQGKMRKRVYLGKGSVSSIVRWKNMWAVGSTNGEIFLLNDELNIIERFHFGSVFSSLFTEMFVEDEKLVAFSSRNRLYVFR